MLENFLTKTESPLGIVTVTGPDRKFKYLWLYWVEAMLMVHRPKPGFHVLLYGGRQGQTTGALTITVFQQKKKENRTHEGGRVGAGCCSSSRSCSTPSSWSCAAPGTVLHTWVFHLFEVVHTLSCSPSWEWCLPGCSIQVRCSPELFVPCWRRALTKTRGMRTGIVVHGERNYVLFLGIRNT